jgi:hypothetical protein
VNNEKNEKPRMGIGLVFRGDHRQTSIAVEYSNVRNDDMI